MAKPEWGTKRICPNCGARYYDLRKEPPVCPTCGTPFDPEALLKSRRARPVAVEEVKRLPPEVEDEDLEGGLEAEEGEDVEGDVAVEDLGEGEGGPEDEEDVLIEDTSELGEDDMEVVEVEGDDEEER